MILFYDMAEYLYKFLLNGYKTFLNGVFGAAAYTNFDGGKTPKSLSGKFSPKQFVFFLQITKSSNKCSETTFLEGFQKICLRRQNEWQFLLFGSLVGFSDFFEINFLHRSPRVSIDSRRIKPSRVTFWLVLTLANVSFWSIYDLQKKVKRCVLGHYFMFLERPAHVVSEYVSIFELKKIFKLLRLFKSIVILGPGSKFLNVCFSSKNDPIFENSTVLVVSRAKLSEPQMKNLQ